MRRALAILLLGALGCAATSPPERPAAPPPPRVIDDVPPPAPPPPPAPAAVAPAPAAAPSARALAVADTAAAGKAVRRCRGRRLLPDQESTIEAVVDLLRQAHAALAQGRNDRAASTARSARQLAASLRCP